LFSLALAGLAFVYLLQPYQTQQAFTRLATLSMPVTGQIRMLELQQATPTEISNFIEEQARDLDVRILLLRRDSQKVAFDTGDTLQDYEFTFQGSPRSGQSPVTEGTADVPGEGTLAFVMVPSPRLNFPDRFRGRFPGDL